MAKQPLSNSHHSPTRGNRLHVTISHGRHSWSFSSSASDAPMLLKRVAELARDPQAPLDAEDASLLRKWWALQRGT